MAKKVFISHGHDSIAREKVKRFLSQEMGYEPIILNEQPGRQGLTIIEALERFSEGCVFAIVLITGDDMTTEGSRRARQNVIHELGYFQGRLGRKKVLLLIEDGIELPTNMAGLFHIPFNQDVSETFAQCRQILEHEDASEYARAIPAYKIVYLSADGRTILMVQTFADNLERGPTYHLTNPRRALKYVLKVFGNRKHPVPDSTAEECLQNAVDNILDLDPDVIGLGGMGRTARKIRARLDSLGCRAEIGFWGQDVGIDAGLFLERYGVDPPYEE